MKKFLITILAIMMTATCAVPVFADEIDDDAYYTADPIYLGTNDPLAVIGDAVEPDPFASRARSNTLLFSFTASNVYYMVATSGSKTFTRSSLTNGYLKVSGKGSYSYSASTTKFRAGGCRYDGSSYVTNALQYIEFSNGVSNYGYIPRSDFSSAYTYYGFVTNYYQNGTISLSGTFYLYNSDGVS